MTTALDEAAPPTERRKVRHALVSWQEKGRVLNAFRGQIVTLPASEIQRLEEAAGPGNPPFVDPEKDLDRPGVLMELPLSPSDEELINWVLSASPAEVGSLAAQRPELGPRLEGALRHIVNERERQDAHLENVRKALSGLPGADEPQPGTVEYATGGPIDDDIIFATPPNPATGGSSDAVVLPPRQDHQEPSEPPSVPAASAVAQIVQGTVEEVSAYLAEHPEQAQLILSAETEHKGGQPRAGVMRAVQVAATFAPPEPTG